MKLYTEILATTYVQRIALEINCTPRYPYEYNLRTAACRTSSAKYLDYTLRTRYVVRLTNVNRGKLILKYK